MCNVASETHQYPMETHRDRVYSTVLDQQRTPVMNQENAKLATKHFESINSLMLTLCKQNFNRRIRKFGKVARYFFLIDFFLQFNVTTLCSLYPHGRISNGSEGGQTIRWPPSPPPPPPTFELFIPSTTIIKKMHNLPFIGCLCLKQMILEMPMESECISQMEFELNESQNNARIRHKSGLHTGERVFSVCCIQKYVHRYKAGRHFSERTQRSSQPTSLLCHTDSR